eukprot:1306672-Rhodomonas_salina.3
MITAIVHEQGWFRTTAPGSSRTRRSLNRAFRPRPVRITLSSLRGSCGSWCLPLDPLPCGRLRLALP